MFTAKTIMINSLVIRWPDVYSLRVWNVRRRRTYRSLFFDPRIRIYIFIYIICGVYLFLVRAMFWAMFDYVLYTVAMYYCCYSFCVSLYTRLFVYLKQLLEGNACAMCADSIYNICCAFSLQATLGEDNCFLIWFFFKHCLVYVCLYSLWKR